MTKKLIALISTQEKSQEEIARQASEAVIKYKTVSLGLKKCDICGEYKGEVTDDGEILEVDCICNGILCTRCRKVKIHRPISNYFDNVDMQIWHVPYFHTFCSECNK